MSIEGSFILLRMILGFLRQEYVMDELLCPCPNMPLCFAVIPTLRDTGLAKAPFNPRSEDCHALVQPVLQ